MKGHVNLRFSDNRCWLPCEPLKDSILGERFTGFQTVTDRIADDIFRVNFVPRSLDLFAFDRLRHDHHTVFIGKDQIAGMERHPVNFHGHIDVDNALPV